MMMEDADDQSAAQQGSGDGGMSTKSLYATLGLAPEDVDALAQIPENEISVETLPYLIMQLKAKREKQAEKVEASMIDEQQEDVTDVREASVEDSTCQDSPPAVRHRSNSHGDTVNQKVEIHNRPERQMEPRRDSRSTRPPKEKLSDSQSGVPFSYQVNDFHGFVPTVFPHKCSLCFCMLNSPVTWKEHLNGIRHAGGCRELLRLYPDWERQESTRKMPNVIPGRDAISLPSRTPRPAVSYKRKYVSDRVEGEVWSSSERQTFPLKPKAGTKVVVTKFSLGTVAVEDLMALAKPFGTVVKHLVCPYKGFLEFGSHEEAVNMVNYYTENEAFVKGKKLTLFLSPELVSIQVPRFGEPSEGRTCNKGSNTVVCFSRVPPGNERESEILDIAKMFGRVRHSTFSGDQAHIEMVDLEDADIMVKYYHSNRLKIDGKWVKVSFSLKRLRESPDSTSRRVESNKRHSSRHKSEEKSKMSSSTNKEKPTTGGQPEECLQSTSEEGKEDSTEEIKEQETKKEENQKEVETQEQGSGDGGMSTKCLYATLGLAPEDVDALAQIPENEISVETLPYLIMQLKAKREKQAEKVEASMIDEQQEDVTDVREASVEDSTCQDSPPAVRHRSNSHGDTVNQKVEIHNRPERQMEPRRDSRSTRPPKEKLSDSQSEFPFSYQVNDFHGFVPKVFPHKCSLCSSMLSSPVTWNEHLNGIRHSEGCQELLRLYPDWERQDYRRKMPNFIQGRDAMSTPRRTSNPAMSYKRNYDSDRVGGDYTHVSKSRLIQKKSAQFTPKPGTKVVVTKFSLGTVAVEDLMALAKPFGTVVKHLVCIYKGFLEFGSHEEAVNMVNYYKENEACVKGKTLSVYLSPELVSIQVPRFGEPSEGRTCNKGSNTVVCFSRVPPGNERESEILDIAKMFGRVRHSTFSGDQALIEMVDLEDADIMVKYYHSNRLKIDGKWVKVSFSLKRLRESPDSTSRREESSKRHSSRHKSEEKSKMSSSTNKEKPTTGGQPEECQLSTSEEGKEDATEDIEEEETKKEENPVEIQEEVIDPQEEKVETQKDDEVKEEINLEKEDGEDEGIQDEPKMLDDGIGTVAGTDGISLEGEDKGGPDITEVLADGTLEDSDLKAADDSAVCDADVSMEGMMEQRSFHEDDQENMDDSDFPENLDDFVTLDELDDTAGGDDSLEPDSSWDGKVVHISPILKGYRNLDGPLLSLAKRARVEVVNYSISFYGEEAWIELDTTEEAHAMVNFYQGNGHLLGRRVNICMCYSQKKLEGPSGRSVYICSLPLQKYSDVSLLRLAQPFGKITGYHLNWQVGECYIQMESVEAAEKLVKKFLYSRTKFYGTLLRVSLCKKGDSLIPWRPPTKYEKWLESQNSRRSHDHYSDEETNGQSANVSSKRDVQSPVSDHEGVCGDPEEKPSGVEAVPDEEKKQQEPLGPYQPDNPVGLDYLVPRSGFFCKLCKVFYTNENTAKYVHCCSEEHYLNLKVFRNWQRCLELPGLKNFIQKRKL
ncbi:hypothetical protein DPEC_G00235260 [Dallia pectoralis]|uniref:Uncharacterized protein n=1 Tax=Dallia pectoralis TaxID=75939 RepID=A0ACC2FY65_DALPE|nr:hypothetical protein DPEC_G00235260 [Dallia pectoralis]